VSKSTIEVVFTGINGSSAGVELGTIGPELMVGIGIRLGNNSSSS
jgi:hypothetical protein